MADKLASQISEIIRKASGIEQGSILLHEPFFDGNERQYVANCIDTNWVSTVGKFVNLFEELLSKVTGVKHAIATVNGTAALHICLILAGVLRDEEVLTQALTFVAAPNSISYCGAVPNFVDVSPVSLGICPDRLREYLKKTGELKADGLFNRETGRRIRALMVMHTFGHPSHLNELQKVCEEFNLVMIEDAAEAIGSEYDGKHVGHHGLLSALSFNGNKILTTGGGGAILTNDDQLAERARHLTTTGKISHQWEYYHDCVAYNYRMPNINAALGCAQLEELSEILTKKRLLASRYNSEFSKLAGISFFNEMPGVKSNYWLNAIILDEVSRERRNLLLEQLNKKGIMVRPAWNLANTLPMYENCPADDLSVSKRIEDSLINVPSSPSF